MSFSEGYKKVEAQFSYYEETTPKTRPTNIDTWLTLESEPTPPLPEKDAKAYYAPGGGRAPVFATTKRKWQLPGNFSYLVQDGEFIGAIMGICVTTGADPYTHTNDKANLPWFSTQTAWDSTADLIMEFLGCKVDTATFKASDEAPELICDVDYKACVPSDGSTLESLTPITTVPYVFKEGVFSSTSLYTGARARIHGFESKVSNNLKEVYAPGQFWPYDLVEGYQEYELKLTAGIEDDAEWDELIDATDKTYDYSYLMTRGADDTFKISGNAKLIKAPYNLGENDLRAELFFLPISKTVTIVDSTATYQFE
jgi:hypothetical protein